MGMQMAKIKIEGGQLWMAGSKIGLDKFVPLNPSMNEEEKKLWNALKTDDERKKEIMKDMAKKGFKLLHTES